MDSDNQRGLTQRHGLVESRMLGNGHVRFGGRVEERTSRKADTAPRPDPTPMSRSPAAGHTCTGRSISMGR
jgi:hypothetical protein